MELRNLGRSGLRVSAIGLGCNNFGGRIGLEATRAVVHKAIDLGITLFDTADVYGERGGSETLMGQVLGDRRKDIVLATKFGSPMDDVGVRKGGARRYIMAAVEDSLRRLRTDWIDLYQIHTLDPLTPIEETLRALDDLVRQGKVRYVGCSNFPAWRVTVAHWTARARGLNPFVSCQDEYSLVFRAPEAELMPAARAAGMGSAAVLPARQRAADGEVPEKRADAGGDAARGDAAAGGSLFDRTELGNCRDGWAISPRRGGMGMLELAFSWLLSRDPVASVIAGATRPEQLEQNVRAGAWTLTAEEQGRDRADHRGLSFG